MSLNELGGVIYNALAKQQNRKIEKKSGTALLTGGAPHSA